MSEGGFRYMHPFLAQIWSNEIIDKKILHTNLKLADAAPDFKKKDSTFPDNYRPVSVLFTVSKVFEKRMQAQQNNYINRVLSPFSCGYRKGYSTQFVLMSLENWKTCLDQKGYAGAVLIDLSTVFDRINHELLVAKFHAYGFSKEALKIILSYL